MTQKTLGCCRRLRTGCCRVLPGRSPGSVCPVGSALPACSPRYRPQRLENRLHCLMKKCDVSFWYISFPVSGWRYAKTKTVFGILDSVCLLDNITSPILANIEILLHSTSISTQQNDLPTMVNFGFQHTAKVLSLYIHDPIYLFYWCFQLVTTKCESQDLDPLLHTLFPKSHLNF